MANTVQPTFRELDLNEADRLLTRNHVGRIAYCFHGRVDIEPISYVYADGVLYMRTTPGSKLAMLAHAPWVAFEVDEVAGPLDWRSVVAHGTVYILANTGSPIARTSYRNAIRQLRTLVPHALDAEDPTPERAVIMQVHLDTVTGRAAEPITVDRVGASAAAANAC